MIFRLFTTGILLFWAGRPLCLSAQDTVTTWVRENYARRDAMIPMRDGVRLFTTIYSPRDSSQKWPILLSRTPFATDGILRILGPGPAFAREGFIFVYQDVRGRFQSEGEFEQVRPFNPAKKGNQTDEASDASTPSSGCLRMSRATMDGSGCTDIPIAGSTPRSAS